MNDKLRQFYNDKFRKENLILSEQSKAKVKDKIFANLGAQIVEDAPVSVWKKLSGLLLKTYVLVPLVVLLFISSTAVASAHALPGDILYPVKRQVENAQILLAPSEDAKLDLQVKFAQKRLDEAEELKVVNASEDSNVNNVNNNAKIRNEERKNDSDQNSDHKQSGKNKVIQNARQQNAHKQADDAVNFLNQTKKKLEDSGREQKAKDIQNRIDQFKKDIQEKLNDSGEVKGESTIKTEAQTNNSNTNTDNTTKINTTTPVVPIKTPDIGSILH